MLKSSHYDGKEIRKKKIKLKEVSDEMRDIEIILINYPCRQVNGLNNTFDPFNKHEIFVNIFKHEMFVTNSLGI